MGGIEGLLCPWGACAGPGDAHMEPGRAGRELGCKGSLLEGNTQHSGRKRG